MRHSTPGLTLAGIAALLLVACGGGGGGSSSSGGTTPNTAPVANAGAAQTVTSGATVTLNGTASTDSDGSIAGYNWTQTAGTGVTLSSSVVAQPTFTAPTVASATTLTFSLVVTDNRGASSTAATVNITVNPSAAGTVTVTGNITFARVLFATAAQDPDRGLWYAAPVQQPARGVIVRALDANTQAELASASTGDTGNYSLSVASNTTIAIQVVARMLRDSTQALPHWNVSVQDGHSATGTPYSYIDPASFNSSAGTAHNVAIPTGINASGTATGTRASGPFAILDTVYMGIQTILGVRADADFPTLVVDWGSQTDGTFFTTGSPQYIALLAALNSDTDEFDTHVIAHEFGHYIENNFSRADNIGGSHGLGDKLDPRVAFGEGFGYAFAAIVMNDPVARDSANDNGNLWSGVFNFETNPTSVVTPGMNYGCWCSESSVWSILWDLYDSNADANDTLALGFQPMWNVLTGAQRTTPAFTTIFSFITALKAQNAGSAAAIDTLIAAQNVTGTNINAYGSTETHSPVEVPSNAALPLYTVATVGGGPVTLRTVDDAETQGVPEDGYNKIGDRRFVRFTLAAQRTITITASSSNPNNPDVDFIVYRNGAFLNSATSAPAAAEILTLNAAAGEYLIDVYDCANGCSELPQGTSGDYDLTVTIN
jgi:hypothetical protein